LRARIFNVHVSLALVGVQEVRWEGGGTEPAGECTFFYGRGNENNELVKGYSYRQQIVILTTIWWWQKLGRD
jgi:hypothetical protein